MWQLVKGGNIDYLIGDYLAELTMSILNRARQRNPKMGFATGWVSDVIKPLCKEIKAKNIKLVTNSGGLNPLGCREALLQVAAAAGVEFKVGVVLGDDQMSRSEEFRERGVKEMHLGSPMPDKVNQALHCHCHNTKPRTHPP